MNSDWLVCMWWFKVLAILRNLFAFLWTFLSLAVFFVSLFLPMSILALKNYLSILSDWKLAVCCLILLFEVMSDFFSVVTVWMSEKETMPLYIFVFGYVHMCAWAACMYMCMCVCVWHLWYMFGYVRMILPSVSWLLSGQIKAVSVNNTFCIMQHYDNNNVYL